jgi:hypothetical protein
MTIANPLTAVRAHLLNDADLRTLASTRVYAGELPKTEASNMPRQAVVVTLAGGAGPASDVPIMQIVIDVTCYGATGLQATSLYLATRAALRALRRDLAADSLLHSAVELTGPRELRDPDTDWPLTWSSWRVIASE